MSIGQRIKDILVEKNISQYRLSKDSGVCQSYINGLINGKYNNPTIEPLKKIAKVLNVPISKLID